MAKIKTLYDMNSFAALQNSAQARGFQDSAGGVILARNLTVIDPTILETRYPELSFVNSGITFNNSGGYAKIIGTLRKAPHGNFANVGDAAGNKGKITMSLEDTYIPVIARQAHSIWTDDEIKEAALQGINLVSDFIVAHRQVYLQEIDDIGYLGVTANDNATIKSRGLLNNTLFASDNASDNIEDLTFQEAYDEISGLINAQWSAVNNIPQYMANRVAMPQRVLNALSSKIEFINNMYVNVLEALRRNFPGVQFLSTTKAESVSAFSDVSVTCAYSTNTDAMVMRVPIPLTVGQIVRQASFDFRIDSKYRVAGLDILEPKAGRYLKGL